MNAIFRSDDFAIQTVSTGSFLDNDPGYGGKIYLVETSVIRLNHVALNEWVFSQVNNCRECYETDQEWTDYLAQKEAKAQAFKDKIAAAVGYDPANGSISITQAVSEVFTVVHIHDVK